MSDYSSVAPPKNFSQSTAFAAALQRAKQIAAKINPTSAASGAGGPPPGSGDAGRPKRSLEDGSEPEAKKLAGLDYNSSNSGGLSAAAAQAAAVAARVAQNLGGLGSGGPMGGGSGSGGTCSEDIRVPDKMVGLIIGRGGEQITRLQAECGCKIQMAPDSGGLPDRLCSLSGPRDAVARAREMIMNIVNQRGRTEGLEMGGNGGGSGAPPMGMSSGPTSVEIMIPGPKVGLIIGKGGETIKQLQEKSGAKMVVIQDGPNPEQEKPLRITGDMQKVEFAKQLVYDLIAEKEMQAFNRGGRMGGNGGPGRPDGMGQDFPSGGGEWVEVFVPKIAVGVVIGKGGDMIKKIQMDTGCRLQFQQNRDEGPGDRLCYLQGKPQQVQAAKDMIEDLIDSVQRDPSERGRPRNGNRPNNGQDFQNWAGGNGSQSNRIEVTFIVPSMKCGVIIGRGGETIKQINAQSGAHCVLDRNAQNNPNEKLFIIRGEPDQVEAAKRIISETVQMPLNFQVTSGNPQGNSGNMGPMGHTGYPGMGAPQGYPGAAQAWGYNPQGWGAPDQTQHAQAPTGQVQINPATGQPDYSQQWIEYYRSMGMHREASMIEQQSKGKAVDPSAAAGQNGTAAPVQPQTAAQPSQQAVAGAVSQMAGAQPDYSAQWAEYYRSIGNIKEAEAIEANMKQGKGAQASAATTTQQNATSFPNAGVNTSATQQSQPGPPGAYGQPNAPPGQPGYPMNAASYMQAAGGMPRTNPATGAGAQFQGYPGYGGYPQQGSS